MKKNLGIAFILLISMILGASLTFFAYTQPVLQLNPAFETNGIQTTSKLNDQLQKEFLSVVGEYEAIGKSLKLAVKNALLYGLEGDGKGIYYHNPKVLGEPPEFKKEILYNEKVSKEAASVYFLPSAFENSYRQNYLENATETENPFSHLRGEVYEQFNKTSLIFPLMKLNQRADISFMRFASVSGFLLTYPYISYEKDYDFTKDAWYQSGLIGAKDVVIAIDTSGSMNVSQFEAVKNSTFQIINSLSPTDRFTMISFSDRISKLSPRLLVATETNKELAKTFIDRMRLGGLSDMGLGTTEALKIISNYGYRRNERIMITITDGFPNSGILDNETLATTINKENGIAQAKLIYYGVNQKVNVPLLSFLENETSGFFQIVNSSKLILEKIPQYASFIGEPTTEFITWGTPQIDSKMNRIEVNVSMSIVVQEKVVGILNLEIDLKPFLNVLKENLKIKSQESFIITVGRSVFVHPQYDLLDLKIASPSDVPQPIEKILFESPDLETSFSGFLRGKFKTGLITDNQGEKYYLAFTSLGQTGLTVGTTIPKDSLIPRSAVEKLKGLELTPELFSGMYPVFGVAAFSAFVIFLLRKRFFLEVDEK